MKVIWARPAAEAFHKLPEAVQEEVAYRIEMISEFPDMYPIRMHQPFAGFRYFFSKEWCVSYTVAQDVIVILAVFHARRGS